MDQGKFVLAGLLLLAAGGAGAQEASRFSSPEQAQQLIDQITRERAEVEQRAVQDQRVCYDKFFTTNCLDAVRERRREALGKLRDSEVEARAWLRRDKADRRDAALEQKRVEDERDARERAADVKAREEALERKRLSSEERQRTAAARPDAPAQDPRVMKFEQAQRERQQRAAQEEAQRKRNVEAYQRKQQEAEEKQREVARRKEEAQARPVPGAAPGATPGVPQ